MSMFYLLFVDLSFPTSTPNSPNPKSEARVRGKN